MSKVLRTEAVTQDECTQGADAERHLEDKFKMRMQRCSYSKRKHLDITMQAKKSHYSKRKKKKNLTPLVYPEKPTTAGSR